MSAPLISYSIYHKHRFVTKCTTLREVKEVIDICNSFNIVDLKIFKEEKIDNVTTCSLLQSTELDKI